MPLQSEILRELQTLCTKLWTAVETKSIRHLHAKDFRIINSCRKLKTIEKDHQEILVHLSEGLLQILKSGELYLESQIIASTAFCLLITQQHGDQTLDKFKEILFSYSFKSFEIDDITHRKRKDTFNICFFYGVLQCEHQFWTNACNIPSINDLINNYICPVILELCLQYNNLCFISFKVLVTLIKRINSICLTDIQFSETNFRGIMNIIMSNWENPLSGVREQNLLIMEQLFILKSDHWKMYYETSDCDRNNLCGFINLILTELSWMMKSKYFILSAVLRCCGVNKVMDVYKEDIVSGLLSSLKFTHLVSAGTDVYQIILSSYNLNQWKQTFFIPIVEALTQLPHRLFTENVISYWLPYTTKTYPASLECLLKELLIQKNTNLFSYISLLKLARKEGQGIAQWGTIHNDPLILSGLLSECDKIRSQAFYLICISSRTSIPPSAEEINLLQMFLFQNVNIDNAVMRQNLLNAFTLFINRLRDSTLYDIKKQVILEEKNIVHYYCEGFLKWIHQFLLNNFQFDSNYQRKFTSLQMYKTILKSFYLPTNKSRVEGKIVDDMQLFEVMREASKTYSFISAESKRILINNIYDSTEDVRTLAAEILISYFNIHETECQYYIKLLQDSLKLSSDPIFYKAESGALLFKTILALMCNSSFCKGDDVFRIEFGDTIYSYIIKSLEKQLELFTDDMLSAVINGSSLYGFLNILEKLLSGGFQPTDSLSSEEIRRIIVLVENIISLLLRVLSSQSDPSSDYAPSFAEMGMAVALIVDQSSMTDEDLGNAQLEEYTTGEGNFEDLQLTPPQQLVLNCIWHNMKVCCRIASKLAASPLNVSDSQRCMALLCQVLCKCRHKGAIESAGLALYQATKYLTSSDKMELCEIPQKLLHQFLNSLINANSTTVSRRSAGLSILIHRIATGDSQLGKPLLHVCVSKFIEILQDFEEPEELLLVDLPQTQSLHFLKTLVQDSSLRQEMTNYITLTSLLCLTYLGSKIWTLRNAALQLFGALLPKLTGQNKIQESEFNSTNNHLAIEELYCHNKPLIEMILKEFSFANSTNSLQIHSRIMPLLTLLSNFTVTFQSLHDPELHSICKQLSEQFYCLFKSEIYNVRKLSAMCSAWFCLPSEIVKCINDRVNNIIGYVLKNQSTIVSNDDLHGCLLNVKYLIEHFNESKHANKVIIKEEESLKFCLKKLNRIVKPNITNHFIVQSVILDIIRDIRRESCLNLTEITNVLIHYPVISGPYHSACLDLQELLTNCDSHSIIDILNHCFSFNNLDIHRTCLNVVKNRIRTENCLDIFSSVFDSLNKVIYKENCVSQIIEIILEILLHVLNTNCSLCLNVQLDFYLTIVFDSKYGSKCSILALPVICGIINRLSGAFSFFNQLCLEIVSRAQPTFVEEIRMSAAKSLHFIFPILQNLNCSDYIGKRIWKTVVTLLQDEDKEIRLDVSKFLFKYFQNHMETWIVYTYSLSLFDVSLNLKNCNPFVALEFLFSTKCLSKFMSESCAMLTMWEMLSPSETLLTDKSIKVTLNPFCSYKNNIYQEEIIIIKMIRKSIFSFIDILNKERLIEVQHLILDQGSLELGTENVNENMDLRCKKDKFKAQIFNVLVEKN